MANSFLRRTLELEDGSAFRFAIFGASSDTAQHRPPIICLHPGWSGVLPATYYGEQFLSSLFAPALGGAGAMIVAPDCPAPAWNHIESKAAILRLLEHLQEAYGLASERAALIGYSAGGWGAWYFLRAESKPFCSATMLATSPVVDPVKRFEENFEQVSHDSNQ